LVSSALLQSVSAAPEGDMKAFLSNEQIPDNQKFTIKIEPSSTRPVCNVMCQIQQINLSDKEHQLKQPKDPFIITG